MIDPEKLARINALANKAKVTPLTPEEIIEQKALRDEYLGNLRTYVKGHLSTVKYVKK